MAKVVTFGEIMLRLNPRGYLKLLQADSFEATYTGAEANVAVSLANYGHDAWFVSKVPAHEVGQCAINCVRKYGVNTSWIVRGGSRLGMFYLEKGASQRPSKVIYDRTASAIAQAASSDFDWDAILKGADWFHFTGITPALGGELAQICLHALKLCKARGIATSCDLNYREKLWTREEANHVMTELVQYVDVLIANEEDAKDVFGIEASNTDIQSGKLDNKGYIDVAQQLSSRFGCRAVAITLRGSISASENNWAGMLYEDGNVCFSKNYLIRLVDRVGGGDSFGGGLIHALLSGMDKQAALEFAVAASCLKQTIEQDYNLVSETDVIALANGNESGRVQR